MICFLFEETARLNFTTGIRVSIDNPNIVTRPLGFLVMSVAQWDALQAMLKHGGTWFQENEATIKIVEHSSVNAYMEGRDGRETS